MSFILADSMSLLGWANTAIALLGLCASIFALLYSRRSNHAASEANHISREANRLAEQAVKMQEEESQTRLVVKPHMMCIIGEGEDSRPRPVVEVINLSAFPVTISKICWKTNRAEKAWFYWKNPTICDPFGQLPARLPSHEALTAVGTPSSFHSLEDLQAVTAAVAFTACGEQVEGMTNEWKEEVGRISNSKAS